MNPINNFYETSIVTTTKDGQCVQEISIKGRGVNDIFGFPCSVRNMVSHISNEDVLVAGKDTVQINSIYGKQPGQLQVIQEGKCSVRTYTTSSGSTTASLSSVDGAECDAMKKEHLERMQKWQKWEAETFPDCFPFCDTAKPGVTAPLPGATAPLPSNPPGAVPQYYTPWNANPFTESTNPSPYVPSGSFMSNPSFNQFLAALMQMMNRY